MLRMSILAGGAGRRIDCPTPALPFQRDTLSAQPPCWADAQSRLIPAFRPNDAVSSVVARWRIGVPLRECRVFDQRARRAGIGFRAPASRNWRRLVSARLAPSNPVSPLLWLLICEKQGPRLVTDWISPTGSLGRTDTNDTIQTLVRNSDRAMLTPWPWRRSWPQFSIMPHPRTGKVAVS